jgi:hypothetical protein
MHDTHGEIGAKRCSEPVFGARPRSDQARSRFRLVAADSFSFSFVSRRSFPKGARATRAGLGSAWVGLVGGSGMWSGGGAKKWGGPGFDQKNTPVPPFDSAKRRRRETRIREALRLYESTNSTNGIIFYIDVFLAIHF